MTLFLSPSLSLTYSQYLCLSHTHTPTHTHSHSPIVVKAVVEFVVIVHMVHEAELDELLADQQSFIHGLCQTR